ncbi:hypothetical protein [Agrobacterium cavarae]|uniref:hypothetical protein n=1 Tax=Agrobacterium cavarae TaxID=2528239 RepID=UPI0028B1A90F|nr:hypothetical protein [Agrobacterium cavarae]
MSDTIREWLRADAEQRIVDVLDDAKRGRVQRIVDREGVFELTFRADNGQNAADILSRGGPSDD